MLQAVANDSSGSVVPLTGSMKQALMDRVDAYGDHHTLRCLALASRPLAASNEPVGAPHCSRRLWDAGGWTYPSFIDRLHPASSSALCR